LLANERKSSSCSSIFFCNGVEIMAEGQSAPNPSAKTPPVGERLQLNLQALPSGHPYPIEQWNPPFCGDIDMRIAHDGTWFYNKTPILREAMVKLFARLLRKDGADYFLVTPVERVGITVEDLPFIAVEMKVETSTETGEQGLRFRTNVEDWVLADAAHPLGCETAGDAGFKPYICIRNGLLARLTRSLSQDLAALGEIEERDGIEWFGVKSAGVFFPLARADTIFETVKDLE
jgi:hypothetical protein